MFLYTKSFTLLLLFLGAFKEMNLLNSPQRPITAEFFPSFSFFASQVTFTFRDVIVECCTLHYLASFFSI